MLLIRSLMTEKISVHAGFSVASVRLLRFFSNGKGQGTVRVFCFNLMYNRKKSFICIISVLSSLKNKSPESQFITLLTAEENVFFCQSVSLGIFVAAADTTVITVIFAVIGKFNQSSYINDISVYLLANFISKVSGILICLFTSFRKELYPLFSVQAACRMKSVN